jgi:beta-galactosidase
MPHLRINLNNKPLLLLIALLSSWDLLAQKIIFDRDFSPSEGLVSQYEFPYREEICLNGLWNFQAVLVPSDWKRGTGIAPLLTKPINDKWEKVKIKIPSAINVNDWGNGYKTGKNTERPYAPSTIYYPSYPENWVHARMGWLRKTFSIPQKWYDKRLIIHFEGVAGDCAVLINGKQVCHNFDTFLPFEADITDMVNLSQENEILVGVRHSRLFDVSHPVYTKFGATYPPGSNMDNLLGIWNDVFLWAVQIGRAHV